MRPRKHLGSASEAPLKSATRTSGAHRNPSEAFGGRAQDCDLNYASVAFWLEGWISDALVISVIQRICSEDNVAKQQCSKGR